MYFHHYFLALNVFSSSCSTKNRAKQKNFFVKDGLPYKAKVSPSVLPFSPRVKMQNGCKLLAWVWILSADTILAMTLVCPLLNFKHLIMQNYKLDIFWGIVTEIFFFFFSLILRIKYSQNFGHMCNWCVLVI